MTRLLRSRGHWFVVAFLVGYITAIPTFAANIMINFDPTQNPSQTGLLLAEVKGAVFDARLEFGAGSADRESENEKCKLLVELAGTAPISVFQNAVSTTLAAEMTFSESRDGATFGKAWSEALGQYGKKHGVEFDALASGKDALPITQTLQFDIALADDTRFEVTDPLRTYIISKMSDWLNKEAKRNIGIFYETGILRAKTRDQSIICGLLAFEAIEIKAKVSARVNDRVTRTPILDKECLGRIVELASAEFFKRYTHVTQLAGSFHGKSP